MKYTSLRWKSLGTRVRILKIHHIPEKPPRYLSLTSSHFWKCTTYLRTPRYLSYLYFISVIFENAVDMTLTVAPCYQFFNTILSSSGPSRIHIYVLYRPLDHTCLDNYRRREFRECRTRFASMKGKKGGRGERREEPTRDYRPSRTLEANKQYGLKNN